MQEKRPPNRAWQFPFLFGILLPIAAVVIDPLVFSGNGLLSDWQGAGYALVAIGIGSMTYWLLRRSAPAFLAGVFAVCSLLALFIGILILPFSVIGLTFFGIGVLGFIPFGTAYVFFRGAVGVWKESSSRRRRALQFTVAIVTTGSVLVASQKTSDRLIDSATEVFSRENAHASSAEKLLLMGAAPFGLQKRVVAIWMSENDPVRANRIAERYELVYGRKIAHDEVIFFD